MSNEKIDREVEIVEVPNTGLDSSVTLVLAYWSTFFLLGAIAGYLFREYRFYVKDKDKKDNEKHQR